MQNNTAKATHKKEYLLVLSYILSAIITIIVYLTGGTRKVYANLMYLPIAIVASTHGKKHGIVHALISALLIGPFMPLDIASNSSQEAANWILRLIIYITIAFVIGFFADYYRLEFERNIEKDKEIFESQLETTFDQYNWEESKLAVMEKKAK